MAKRGRPKGSKNPKKTDLSPSQDFILVIKTAAGEYVVREFPTRDAAQAYADIAKLLGCEVLIASGWSE